tara:strand:+ start:43021 stop:44466 length:1446 start_codon:yes stop_codon:yes gene_type:complete
MKTINIYTLLVTILVLISCVQDDEFEVPVVEIKPQNIAASSLLTIDALRTLLNTEIANNGNIETVLSFEADNDTTNDKYILGYVISDDSSGNFFEELILQDAPEDPSRGIKILIDANPLYVTYQFGRKVYVKLEGLTVGYDSGVLSLGIRDGNRLEKIAESAQRDFLFRDDVVEEINPLPISISEFTPEATNLYIHLEDVQFNRYQVLGEARLTFAGEEMDEFDGERILESCAEGTSTVFSTSTFADFKGMLLPDGRGTIDAILTYNFFGDEFNIIVNNPTTIHLDNMERCDPNVIDCGLAATTGSTVLFSDFFETQMEGDPIDGNGWTNYIEAGTEQWEAYTDSGTNASIGISARIGSFMSGDVSSIGWLITPPINFDSQDGETLNFKTSNSFADGSTLEVLISNNWDGDTATISTATWDLLSAAYIVQDDDFFGDWLNSGNIDLTCVTGIAYIAWRYIGSGEEGFDGTYELDEIEINAN